ncbi:MAG TPA: cytochrome c maturation protein CcmE [Candidatus Binatia bacterium]|nr:cytochrome c maturation protein CcmE [Candidatus Binatia bacterium]
MNRSYKFLIGIGVIVATVGFLVWTAVDQTKMYMITVAEFLSAGDSYAGETIRIAGRVAPGTMQWDVSKRDLRFTLKDIAHDGSVDVYYNGLLPDMFAEDRDVVVEGPYTDQKPFKATTVLTACPSKYQAEE